MGDKSLSSTLLPDFFILGAEKCGTTSIREYLLQHDDIAFTSIKEPYLMMGRTGKGRAWLNTLWQANHTPSVADYSKLYPSAAASKMKGEASALYLYNAEEVIPQLYQAYGEPARAIPLVMILRNPVERLWSAFSMKQRNGTETLPFEEAVAKQTIQQRLEQGAHDTYDYIGGGMYSERVAQYLASFDRVLIILYEDLANDADKVCRRILKHIGLPSTSFDTSSRHNVSGAPKNKFYGAIMKLVYQPNVAKSFIKWFLPDADYRHRLKYQLGQFLVKKQPMPINYKNLALEIYRADIEALEAVLGLSLTHWKQA